MFCEAVQKACTREFGYEVVGATASGRKALAILEAKRPDVVILDLSLPDIDGFEVMEAALRTLPSVRILVLSAYADGYMIARAERAGAHGFIDKRSSLVAVLRDALESLATGRNYWPPAIWAVKRRWQQGTRECVNVLSRREQEILSHVGRGLDDAEIAQRMSISRNTAKTHRRNLLRKLSLKSTPKLIAFSIERGFARFLERFTPRTKDGDDLP